MRFITLIAATLLAQAAHASLDVDQLNQLLKSKNAGWTARQTSMSQRSLEEQKTMMGVKGHQARHGIHFYVSRPQKSHATLPAVLDWRSNNGNWITPILDQGYCGSCVAFSTIGTLETQYRISTGFTGFNVRLSPQYLFACGGGSCEMGWEPGDAAQFLETSGVPSEACLPYTSGENDEDVACSKACPNAKTTAVKIASYTTPTSGSLDLTAIKTALQNGPLETTLDVFEDFEEYSSGVYKHTTGSLLGGHAISIIGYDDNQQALIIRNSWGVDWGESGFAYMAYTDVSGVGDETWQYTMPKLSGAVSVQSPIDDSYFTGTAPVTVNSTYPNTDSITVSFMNSSNTAVWSANCAGSTCSQTADVSKLADGQYSVTATAMDSTGKALGTSLIQSFYVSNTQPTLTVSFAGTQGTNLASTLTGIILMQINVSSSNGVPLSSIVFHHTGPNGTVTRAATAVANGMLMDWGTEEDPNGSYDIWFEGHLTTNGFDDVVESQHMTVTTKN